jgi:DNA-binding transcriptional regulator/RsmH inhibitor MraZ
LLEFANIGSQAVVIGVRDHLEIRNPDQWNASLDEKLPKWQQILAQARSRRRAGSVGNNE